MVHDLRTMAWNGDYLALGGVVLLLPIIVPVWIIGRIVGFFIED